MCDFGFIASHRRHLMLLMNVSLISLHMYRGGEVR